MPSLEQLVGVLNALLPGFVAAWVYYGLTAHPKNSPFERVIEAFIFNVFILGIVALIQWALVSIGEWIDDPWGAWTTNVRLVWSIAIAFGFGVLLAGHVNSNLLKSWLSTRDWCLLCRKQYAGGWTWTSRTTFPSIWFSAFVRKARYVVLHLSGERRLYGWPEEWPDTPEEGHFVISEPVWLLDGDDNGGTEKMLELPNVEFLLIPVGEVEFVEFMSAEFNEDQPDVYEKPATAAEPA